MLHWVSICLSCNNLFAPFLATILPLSQHSVTAYCRQQERGWVGWVGLELIDDSRIRRASKEDEKDKNRQEIALSTAKKGAWQLGDKKE